MAQRDWDSSLRRAAFRMTLIQKGSCKMITTRILVKDSDFMIVKDLTCETDDKEIIDDEIKKIKKEPRFEGCTVEVQ